ncbi:DEAD/DEAH box helicase family protein [Candidatus Woesearchaeota archaeon]|nr:DEAD/DEAH box helicase family protein [Candidatus Woesearchaeota archaeon]
MNKKDLSERDICSKYITPAILKAQWDRDKQIREEKTFTDGMIIVRGKKIIRGEQKRADYILYYKPNLPIAIIEAKDNRHTIGSGLQQAIDYGEILDIPFVYSSNGDGFIEHDRTGKSKLIERELTLDEFPGPDELWERYKLWKGIEKEHETIITHNYHTSSGAKTPRYYQEIAINRAIEHIAKGKNRLLLVMATGTGKTYVASQIIYKLWKSKKKKRILYLADRNVLIDQTMNNDFKIFKEAMTKIKNRNVDKSYEIYMALYQGISGSEDWKNIYKAFSKDFFDLVVVDECHRGSAKEDSAWREILEYFNSATQIGMTATPKETKEVSNIDYFGEPIYTYSLKQGIEDGFLAPYKVVKISIDRDVEGWRPTKGQKDKYGAEIEDRIYNSKDFDRTLVIDERTLLVAKKVTEFLKNSGDRFAKTIIFCVDIDHAERMRLALRNENQDMVKKNSKYVLKITGDDDIGKKELDGFIDPASKYPVIATTSKLMTTGVDAQTCKLIVLDSNIQSIAEFKQIIGRGTRIREDYGKYYFTIIDFRQVTDLFADPDFDGEPVQIYEASINTELIIEQAIKEDENKLGLTKQEQIYLKDTDEKPRKYYVKGVPVKVVNQRVLFYDKDGKLITESLKDYTKKTLSGEYASLGKFLKKWNSTEKKSAIIQELEEQGILLDELRNEVGKDYDDFDLICHVAFDKKPLTRQERTRNVKKRNYFAKYGEKAKAVIDALLEKYADEGIENLESLHVLKVNPLNEFGTPFEIIDLFGGKTGYMEAVRELESELYAQV